MDCVNWFVKQYEQRLKAFVYKTRAFSGIETEVADKLFGIDFIRVSNNQVILHRCEYS